MRWMLLVTVLTAGLVAACGSQTDRQGSSAHDATPAAFRATVNTICRGFQAKTARLGTPQSWAQAVRWIDSAERLAAAEMARLRTIKPPESEAVAYQRLMRAGDLLWQLIAPLRRAALARDMHRFRALAALSVRRQRAYDAIARSIGLADCVGVRER